MPVSAPVFLIQKNVDFVWYFPCDYLIRAKIRETTYHFTNGQAGKPIKWGKLEE